MPPTRTERIPLSEPDRKARDKRIASAIKSGVSIADAKRHFKVADRTIRDICQQYGVPTPRVGSKP